MTHIAYMQSPIGWIRLEASDTFLSGASWVAEPEPLKAPPTPLLQETIRQLTEYFAGARHQFELPLQPAGTLFQQKVWEELQRIPYGQTITYGQLAARCGQPKAARAVGSANGKNPIFIIVPCHRVIQSGGKTGGYAYGSAMKDFLLELERKTNQQEAENRTPGLT